jgi:hypothetical protein
MKKIRTALMVLLFGALSGPAFATDADIYLRKDAPIYTGPVDEGDLEELTVDDFESFGIAPEVPWDQYRRYQKILAEPASGIQVPYRMRVVDRDLTQEDFLGFDVSEELAEARYNNYLDMIPVAVDGRTIHYVYVFHSPIGRSGVEYEASNN